MSVRIMVGDVRARLRELLDESVHCVVTSPPYFGLRDYGTAQWQGGEADCDHKGEAMASARSTLAGYTSEAVKLRTNGMPFRDACGKCGARRMDSQIGLEPTPDAFVATMVEVFREVRRVMRRDATCWLNLGTSYASGGMRSNQRRADAPAYGNDDRAPVNSPDLGFSCSDPDDESQDGFPTRHGRIADNGQPLSQVVPPSDATIHNNATLVCSDEGLLPSGAPRSTSLSSRANGQGALDLEATASVSPPEQPTFSDESRLSEHTSDDTNGTARTSQPLDGRKSGKASSGGACNCGSCGICWAYLAIPLLNFKAKDEMNIPHLVAMALQADGWFLRQTIIWGKPNPMPESVRDRCTKAHEYVFLLTKSERYFYDAEAISEPLAVLPHAPGNRKLDASRNDHDSMDKVWGANGLRNRRSVWSIATQPYAEAHFATFPPELPELCIKAGCPAGGTVLDPFGGAGTTGLVADRLGRNAILIELNAGYAAMARSRIEADAGLFAQVAAE